MRLRTLAAACALAVGGVLFIAAPAWAHPVLNITANPTTVTAGSTTTITITGTSNGNYTNARIEVFSGTPSSGGTTGSLTSFTSSPVCAGTPATPTCTEITNRYKLGGINLTNGQAFSYTLTITIDAGTAAGTFTSKAQFYKSDNTTDGPRTGPLITVTVPHADMYLNPISAGMSGGQFEFFFHIGDNGPDSTNAHLSITVSQTSTILTGLASCCGAYFFFPNTPTACATGNNYSCDTQSPFPATFLTHDARWNINLVSIGQFTITMTVNPIGGTVDPDLTNNTISTTCNVVTPLVLTCS